MKLVICLSALLVIIHGAPTDDGNPLSNVFHKISDNAGRALGAAAGNVVGCSSGIYKKEINWIFLF